MSSEKNDGLSPELAKVILAVMIQARAAAREEARAEVARYIRELERTRALHVSSQKASC